MAVVGAQSLAQSLLFCMGLGPKKPSPSLEMLVLDSSEGPMYSRCFFFLFWLKKVDAI